MKIKHLLHDRKTTAAGWLLPLMLALQGPPAMAQEATNADALQIPGTSQISTTSDSRLDLEDAVVAGKPVADKFGWWPSQPVLVPDPGYSQQLGWSVALGAARHYSFREAFRARFCDVSLVMKLTNTPAPTRT